MGRSICLVLAVSFVLAFSFSSVGQTQMRGREDLVRRPSEGAGVTFSSDNVPVALPSGIPVRSAPPARSRSLWERFTDLFRKGGLDGDQPKITDEIGKPENMGSAEPGPARTEGQQTQAR